MENPIDNERNKHATLQEDMEDFVRDLAYGVVKLDWEIELRNFGDVIPYWLHPNPNMEMSDEQIKFRNKWLENPPNMQILIAYDYLKVKEHIRERQGTKRVSYTYFLTSKAFDLLEKPSKRIRVFISYKRNQSSALALLLEARLRLRGVRDDHIFIDKSIAVGELWEERIKREVAACDYFVALVAPNTLDSINVKNEIDWALAANKYVIPICHGGATADVLPDYLQALNVYVVKNESALDYEQGIGHVLNELRFTTY